MMGKVRASCTKGAAWALFWILMTAVQPWGWAAGLPLGAAAGFAVLRAVRSAKEEETRRARIEAAQKSLNLLSRYRHDWLNHVQVIMGYLAMRREERILPFLRELTDRAREEREAAAAGYAPLALALSTLNQRVPEWRWIVEADPELKEITPRWGERLCDALEQASLWLRERGRVLDEPEEVWLRVDRDGAEWTITVQPDFPPELDVEPSEWAHLRDTIREQGGSLDRNPEAGTFILRFAA